MILAPVIIDGHSTVIEIARQRYPAFEAVIQRLGDGRTLRHKLTLGDHPGMKCVGDWCCFFLPYSLPITRLQLSDFSFNFVQGRDVVQRFFGDLALVGRVQIEQLSTCMGHAADFGDAQVEAGLVTREVIADQLAVPTAQEGSGMFASTAQAEVVNDRRQVGELTGGIGSDVSAMSFLRARRQHLYRRLVGVNDAVRQHGFAQCINQRL